MADTTAPVDLTGYLQTLTTRAGYTLQREETDPTYAHHPELVTAWVMAAARHAGIAYARSLLAAPAAYLRDRVAADGPEPPRVVVALLHQLYEHDELLKAALATAGEDFQAVCRRLAAVAEAMISPVATGQDAPMPLQIGQVTTVQEAETLLNPPTHP